MSRTYSFRWLLDDGIIFSGLCFVLAVVSVGFVGHKLVDDRVGQRTPSDFP